MLLEKSLDIYLDYVCERCFHTPMECTCEFKPWNLRFIDRGVQDHVRILNEKGYITNGCCESHYNSNSVNINICFIRDYGFGKTLPLPEGFKTMKSKHTVIYEYKNIKKITEEDMNAQKEVYLNRLLEWCKNLPVNTMR